MIGPAALGHPGDEPAVGYSALDLDAKAEALEALPTTTVAEQRPFPWEEAWYQRNLHAGVSPLDAGPCSLELGLVPSRGGAGPGRRHPAGRLQRADGPREGSHHRGAVGAGTGALIGSVAGGVPGPAR